MSSEIFSQCRLCLQQSNKVRSLFSDNLVQMVENLANIKVKTLLYVKNRLIFDQYQFTVSE